MHYIQMCTDSCTVLYPMYIQACTYMLTCDCAVVVQFQFSVRFHGEDVVQYITVTVSMEIEVGVVSEIQRRVHVTCTTVCYIHTHLRHLICDTCLEEERGEKERSGDIGQNSYVTYKVPYQIS